MGAMLRLNREPRSKRERRAGRDVASTDTVLKPKLESSPGEYWSDRAAAERLLQDAVREYNDRRRGKPDGDDKTPREKALDEIKTSTRKRLALQ